MIELIDDLRIRGSDLYLDSRHDRDLCFVSHAHSDHIACHGCAIATPATAALLSHRIPQSTITPLPYDTDHALSRDLRLRLLPAGHVLGSAMLHVTRPEGTLLYTGDFKLGESMTIEQARPEPADTLVIESTFGLPFFHFPPRDQIVEQLIHLVSAAFHAGRQPIVLAYSLGKSQEATRILSAAGFNVTLHGAPHALSAIYEQLGVKLGPFRRYQFADFTAPAPSTSPNAASSSPRPTPPAPPSSPASRIPAASSSPAGPCSKTPSTATPSITPSPSPTTPTSPSSWKPSTASTPKKSIPSTATKNSPPTSAPAASTPKPSATTPNSPSSTLSAPPPFHGDANSFSPLPCTRGRGKGEGAHWTLTNAQL